MGGRILKVVVCVALVGGCSTAPRPYAPQLAAAPVDPAKFNDDVRYCAELIGTGPTASGGRVKSGVGGAAVGVGAGAVTAGSAASGAGMLAGPAAAAGLATGFLIAAPIATVVIAKSIRAHKEREIKDANTACLQAHGYNVTGWARANGTAPATATPAGRGAGSAAP